MSHEPDRIPPPLLFGVGALVAASLVIVAIARIGNIGVQQTPEAQIIESAMLLFKDEPDGGVGVYAHEDGAQVHTFPPETGGFVRTAMRAVAYKRKIAGAAGPEAPFQLARTEAGRILIIDTVTGETVGLEAFGDANESDFIQLLPSERNNDDA
ncbi:MAG: photosynthetic complex assembly protein PuhC [Pseudomonadota bacterium]